MGSRVKDNNLLTPPPAALIGPEVNKTVLPCSLNNTLV